MTDERKRQLEAMQAQLDGLEAKIKRQPPQATPAIQSARIEFNPYDSAEAIAQNTERAVLKARADALLSPLGEGDRTVNNHGAFSPDDAAVIRQAARAGLLKPGQLVKVEILDPYSHGRRIEFYGDDEGATWHAFANPLRIGRLAEVKKTIAVDATPRAARTRAWYEG